MPVIPLTVRTAMYAEHTGEVEVALVTIEHDDLDGPVRLSSDPTERFSDDPLRYGTTSNANEFDFVLMQVMTPDDRKGTPPRLQIVMENVGFDVVEVAQSFTTPGTVKIEMVLASAPNTVIQTFRDLSIVRCSWDEASATFELSREPFVSEPFCGRQTKNFFPALHGLPSA